MIKIGITLSKKLKLKIEEIVKTRILLAIFISAFYNSFCQKDSSYFDADKYEKDYNLELKKAKAESFVAMVKVIDFELGGNCGSFKAAGTFLCEVKKSVKATLKGEKILVVLQCAADRYSFIKKDSLYTATLTLYKPKYFVHHQVGRFEPLKLKYYYGLHLQRKK